MDKVEHIKNCIYEIRGQRVMLDRDLAELYGVETRVLNQAVKRNIERFPEDFMFIMSEEEMNIWKSQIVMTNVALKTKKTRNMKPRNGEATLRQA